MKGHSISFAIVMLLASVAIAADGPTGTKSTHLIFANYMVCYCKNGQSVEGYKKEIAEAQADGLDGFALDFGGYDKYPYYAQRIPLIFQAAKELNTHFLLFFMVEGGYTPAFTTASMRNLLIQYANHPNYFTYDGKLFLTSWGSVKLGENGWRDEVLRPLKEAGHPVYFIPSFSDPKANASHLPTDWITSNIATGWWGRVIDGFYFFATAALPYGPDHPYYTGVGHNLRFFGG